MQKLVNIGIVIIYFNTIKNVLSLTVNYMASVGKNMNSRYF